MQIAVEGWRAGDMLSVPEEMNRALDEYILRCACSQSAQADGKTSLPPHKTNQKTSQQRQRLEICDVLRKAGSSAKLIEVALLLFAMSHSRLGELKHLPDPANCSLSRQMCFKSEIVDEIARQARLASSSLPFSCMRLRLKEQQTKEMTRNTAKKGKD